MEVINWHTMTPAQRNETIHEKVFGHERRIKHHLVPDTSHVWSIGDHYKIRSVETWQTGGPDTPRYSQSLDAAWLVLQAMADCTQQKFQPFGRFVEIMLAASGWDDAGPWSEIYPAYQIFMMAAKWTPESICIAALRALGYEVVTEEVSNAQ